MYYADEDQYWFEVLNPKLKGSYGVYLSFNSAINLIKSITGNFPSEGYSSFEFNSW